LEGADTIAGREEILSGDGKGFVLPGQQEMGKKKKEKKSCCVTGKGEGGV